jgi:type II secretory pathway predicted ATPase ExeA
MLKIRRVIETGTVFLIVSGRIGAGDLTDLRELVQAEHTADLVLDLAEVNLVDRETVRFLLECEAQGIRLGQCPAYIREWMNRESGLPS